MIDITEKKVPHLFRNKYLRNAGSGSVNTSIQSPGQSTPGASVDIVKTDSATVPSDTNILSSLRTLLEIRSRIIASTDTETALSEENTLSSFRIIAEIDAAITEALDAVDEIYLSKTKADTAAEAITFLKGLFVGDNLAFINASGDAEVKNLVARMKAKVATLEVTGAASVESITVGKTATTLNLLVQELADIYNLNVTHVTTMFRTIIKDYVSSETFVPGLMGEGMKIHKALNGDWNLEIDNVVIRKVMTIFELVVSKIRAVNGGLVISPANGRIKSVAETTGDPAYYVLGIEGDNQFVADDLVRCQVFTSGQAKYYWVPVASVTGDSILILKSEFANGVVPAVGDDLIQMGNRTNTARQGFLYLTASEDGKPRFSVMDGVNSTSTVGKSKVILGCLDGMTDTDFPADFQPSGYGLYAMNVFLKGVFLLRNGKTVESEIASAKSDAQTAKDKADAVTRLFQEFTVAGGLFESKITEVKEYADDKANAAKDAAQAVAIAKAALAKTEASSYADGIVSAEEQRAINDAKAKLEEAKRDAQAKADTAKNAAIDDATGKYNTKSEVTSLISQTKKDINLSVTEKISNVQVGGRNLALESKGHFAGTEYGQVCWLHLSTPLVIGEPYILSYKLNNTVASLSCSVTDSVNSWEDRQSFLNNISFAAAYNSKAVLIWAENPTEKFDIYDVKLERGNKATDWTPAPEDVQTQITANASAIEVNRKGIALKASQEQVNGIGNRLATAESSLTVQARQISAAVSSVDNLSGRMSSAELKLDPSQIWLGIKNNVSTLVPTYTKQIDTKGLDPNKYYLVTIRMSTTVPYTITVERSLDGSYGVPPYSTNSGGFSLICKWQSNGSGWGTINVNRITQAIQYAHVGSCPVGSIGQITESSEEYIYVRGGSVYNVRVDGTSFSDINLRAYTYAPYPAHPSSSRPGVIDSVATPVVDLDTKLTEEQVKAGIGITENGITVFGKTISLTGAVTFNSLSWDAQNVINGKASTGYVDSSKSAAITESRNNVAQNLGYANYADMEAKAIAGQTIITGGKIRTELIDAKAVVTGELIAEQIAATNITTGKLTVTDGAKIGEFRISGGSLSAEHTPAVIGFIYGNNSASLGAGTLMIDKSNTGYAILVRGGAGFVSMDVNSFEVTSKNGLVVSPHYSNPNGIALAINGKIAVNGSYGKTFTVDTFEDWIGGRNKVTYKYVNGILVDYWYR